MWNARNRTGIELPKSASQSTSKTCLINYEKDNSHGTPCRHSPTLHRFAGLSPLPSLCALAFCLVAGALGEAGAPVPAVGIQCLVAMRPPDGPTTSLCVGRGVLWLRRPIQAGNPNVGGCWQHYATVRDCFLGMARWKVGRSCGASGCLPARGLCGGFTAGGYATGNLGGRKDAAEGLEREALTDRHGFHGDLDAARRQMANGLLGRMAERAGSVDFASGRDSGYMDSRFSTDFRRS